MIPSPAQSVLWQGRSCIKWSGLELSLAYSLQKAREHHKGRPDDRLLLCLHGAYCRRKDFNCLFSCPALESYTLLAVDLPGHGESTKIPESEPDAVFPAKMEEMADTVWSLLGKLNLEGVPTIIVAHSLGGTVGLLLAEKHLGPHLRSFVSLEGVLVATDTPDNGIASRWAKKDARRAIASDLLEDIASARHLGRDSVGLSHWKDSAELCGETSHYLAVRMSQSLCHWSKSGELPKKIDGIPVFHYVHGTESGKFSQMLAAALHGRKNCRAHAIHGAGHFLLLGESTQPSLGIIMAAIVESMDLVEIGSATQRTRSAL